jgi:hypothetical protein
VRAQEATKGLIVGSRSVKPRCTHIALVDVPARPFPKPPAAPVLGDRRDRAAAEEWAERRDRQAAAQRAAPCGARK